LKGFKRENLFFVVVALFWFAQYLYVPFYSPYMISLGISASVVGIVVGAYGLTQLVLRIPLSIAGNKAIGHKTIIVSGIGGIILSCVFPIFSDSWIAFLLTRALAGAASSTWISYTAYLLEGADDSANQRMGLLLAANTGGCCASHIVGTLIYGHIGMRMMFVISVCVAVLALILVLLTPFKPRADAAASSSAVNNTAVKLISVNNNIACVLRNRNFWVCSVLELLVQFLIYATILGFTGVFAQEALGAGSVVLGLIAIVCQICSMVVSLVFGKLGRRKLPERGILAVAFLLTAAYCVFLPFCDLTGVILIQIVCGIGFGIGNVIPLANAGKELDDSQQILSMGIFQTIYSIGITTGPAVTGFLFDYTEGNYSVTFTALAAVAAGGAVLTLATYKNMATKDLV
jgi:predicted MFS family arabinose efflux permease